VFFPFGAHHSLRIWEQQDEEVTALAEGSAGYWEAGQVFSIACGFASVSLVRKEAKRDREGAIPDTFWGEMKSPGEKGGDVRTYITHTPCRLPAQSPYLLTHCWVAAWRVGSAGVLPALVGVVGLGSARSLQCCIFLPQGQPSRRKARPDATDRVLKKAGKRSSPTPSPEGPLAPISSWDTGLYVSKASMSSPVHHAYLAMSCSLLSGSSVCLSLVLRTSRLCQD